MTARVLIVDDHALVAVGLRIALAERGWTVETTPVLTADEIINHVRRFTPDCVLLDIRLAPDLIGTDLIAPLRAMGAEVVMLTGETDPGVLACVLEAGAAGWIGKHARLEHVEATLRDVVAGVPLIGRAVREAMLDELRCQRAERRHALAGFEQLTARERDVLAALAEGLCAEQIATSRYVALTTVRSQIRSVLNKLGVRSQLAAVAHANRAGWTPTGAPAAV
jgi:DNA-binding NarL/FixJ family response regulator